jgi:hypothetical protein
MKTILTSRDRDLLLLASKARWLTTAQIHRAYFHNCSVNACQKRLRKLAQTGLLASARPSRTEQQLWRIGVHGAANLHAGGLSTPIPKRPPANLDHFRTINDLRLWFKCELRDGSYSFLAEWELKRGRKLTVIPDALVRIKANRWSLLLAIEVDLATENPGFFALSKLRNYQSFASLNSAANSCYVIVLVSGLRRLKALIKYLYGAPQSTQFLIADIDRFLSTGANSRVLIRLDGETERGGQAVMSLSGLLRSPHCLSSRQEILGALSLD